MDFLLNSAAFVFDMDGLLLDTERLANAALHAAAGDLGLKLPEDTFLEMIGRRGQDIHHRLGRRVGSDALAKDLLARSEAHYETYLARGVPVKAGVMELLAWLTERKFPCTVATSTRTAKAERKLAAAGLRQYFHAVVGGDQVEHGKPAPDVYLRATAAMGVAPGLCTVFEDSEPGLQAAQAAGANAVWVPDLAPVTAAVQVLVARADTLHVVLAFLRAGKI